MAKKVITFSLNTENDALILEWLNNAPKGQKSALIRDALEAARHDVDWHGLSHKLLRVVEALCGPLGLSVFEVLGLDEVLPQDAPL